MIYTRWLKTVGVQPTDTITSNSLIALIGMTVSGLGISYLPRDCLSPMLKTAQLQVIRTTPALPDTTYVALHRGDQHSGFFSSIVRLAQEACDFERLFQAVAG